MNLRLNRFIRTLISSLFKLLTFISLLFPFLKNLPSKTLDLFSVDSMLFDYDDDVFGTSLSLSRPFEPPPDELQLYLVSERWWSEARDSVVSSDVAGVSYVTKSSLVKPENFWDIDELIAEIVMEMRRDEQESLEEDMSNSRCDFALISDWMFLRALKWHNDVEKVGTVLSANHAMQDMFSLKIRYFLGKKNYLVAKISPKDNEPGTFRRACNIFCDEPGLFRIWDFSGQTMQFFISDENIPDDSVLQNEEILLELQLYGLSYITKVRTRQKDEMVEDQFAVEDQFMGDEFSWNDSRKLNGSTDINSNFRVDCQPSTSHYREASALGMSGLLNLGNTCFMNSAIQCLVHTTMFVDYFLGDFKRDLNVENPLGMNGKLAVAFGDLFRKLWTPPARAVAPSIFKSVLSDFAPQFGGYNQHDSQEFLAFLLDGLHEDLNRVKHKPYIEVKDADDLPDEEVADEHWRNHLARNDSIIVDVCQGQFRSKLVCPMCKKVSITFDPFMYLSLPLPSTSLRAMTVTVLSTDGSLMPIPVTVTVPEFGKTSDLVQAVSSACSLRDDETLLLAEVFGGRILHFLDKPYDSLELLRDSDELVAYRLPKDNSGSSHLVVFMHQQNEMPMSIYAASGKTFGIPLLARMSNISKGYEIREQYLKLLNPYIMSVEDDSVEYCDAQNIGNEDFKMKDATSIVVMNGDVNSELEDDDLNSEVEDDLKVENDFQFRLEHSLSGSQIQMDEPLPVSSSSGKILLIVSWPDKMMNLYDTARLSTLPEIFKGSLFSRKPKDSITLYKCLEAFLKVEPLGPEDMWYCPKCKEHRQASKKLDLWRLPEMLVIHLKRFSYSRYFKSKLDTFVDFPVEDFDLSEYIVHKTSKVLQRYVLYAIINHYGSLGGGHYTAFIKHGINQWYEFDDSHVSPVAEEQIKTSAAYVIFYKRV